MGRRTRLLRPPVAVAERTQVAEVQASRLAPERREGTDEYFKVQDDGTKCIESSIQCAV